MDRKMPRYCGTSGNLPRRTVSSDSNFFRVTFHSNHVYDSTGFAANYQFRTVEGTELCSLKQRFVLFLCTVQLQFDSS